MVATGRSLSPNRAYRAVAWGLCFLCGVTIGCHRSETNDTGTGGATDQSASNTTAAAPAPLITSDGPGSETENLFTDQEPLPPRTGDDEPKGSGQAAQPQDATTEPPEPVVSSESTLPREAVEPSGPEDAIADVEPEPDATKPAQPAVALSNVETWEPTVEMSQSHAATCLVLVGDTFPNVELSDLEGTSRRLADLLGSNLTVVVFWDTRFAYAGEQYEQLEREVVQPFGSLGVNVVAINVGDDADGVRNMATASEGKLFNLLDTQQSVYHNVATEKLPRTYLLDAAGKVLWLDIEYSRGTRRELENALHYYLQLEH